MEETSPFLGGPKKTSFFMVKSMLSRQISMVQSPFHPLKTQRPVSGAPPHPAWRWKSSTPRSPIAGSPPQRARWLSFFDELVEGKLYRKAQYLMGK